MNATFKAVGYFVIDHCASFGYKSPLCQVWACSSHYSVFIHVDAKWEGWIKPGHEDRHDDSIFSATSQHWYCLQGYCYELNFFLYISRNKWKKILHNMIHMALSRSLNSRLADKNGCLPCIKPKCMQFISMLDVHLYVVVWCPGLKMNFKEKKCILDCLLREPYSV